MKPTVTGSKLFITLAAMSGALMALLDISIVNVALSDIRASFGTPLDQIAWVSTGYMMANVVVIPMTGWFGTIFGLRRYLSVNTALFVATQILRHGQVRRSHLGVGAQTVALPRRIVRALGRVAESGARLFTVAKDGPGDKARLMNGDLLLTLDGVEVTGVDHQRCR